MTCEAGGVRGYIRGVVKGVTGSRWSVCAVGLACALGCEAHSEGVPEGKLAVVGPSVLGPEDVAAAGAQVGAYGQLRFAGPQGDPALLESLVAAELMALEAVDAGLGDDPRVRFALLEEIATVYLSAELERRVPREDAARDTAALREHYEANPTLFVDPEVRSAQGVVFTNFEEAESALGKLRAGEVELAELGAVVATPLHARDDEEYPAFHPFLFAPTVQQGDLMEHPVFVGESLLVGRVQTVQPASRKPFDAPEVQEALVEAVLAPRRASARAALLAELRRVSTD